MFEHGYLRVGRLAGVDLRLHWSVPVAAALFGSVRIQPLIWLAFGVVITVHQLGHAALVRLRGFALLAIDLTGFGGHCRFRGSASGLERAWIAWGGVLAQLLLLAVTLLGALVLGEPRAAWVGVLGGALLEINLWIIAINLLPFEPLDGARAWRLFKELDAARLTPGQALLRPLGHWARQRRQARYGAAEPWLRSATPSGEAASGKLETETPAADLDAAEADLPQPSPEAQRELAALFERVAEEAARAKRRR
jgi:hypothetical protein